MIMITTLFALSFISFLLLQAFIKHKLAPTRKLPNPGPTTYPIIGCLVSFYKNRHRLLDWYTDMLSMSPLQTITISRLGARRTIVTANPQNVEYMLKTNFENFPKGKPFTDILGDFLGNGIFNVDGDLWHHQRKLVSHEFNVRSLRDYVERVLKGEVENKLVPVLESAAAEGDGSKPVDLQDLLRRLAFDLVCKMSLGFDPHSLEYGSLGKSHPIIEAFDVASIMCAMRGAAPLSISWKIKRFFDVGPEKKLREAISTIHAFIDNAICDRKRSFGVPGTNVDVNEHDLLSKMVLDGKKDEFVRDTMISFIMAGRDTTSAAMTWLFYLLSNHPDVETDVLREIELVEDEDGRHLSEYESLRELRLLKACICESMRLFPPVAWDSKHPLANDTLPDGTRVRAGDRVTYFPYGMGRMEGLWGEDRFEFKPERWISEMDHVKGRVKALKNVGPYKFPVFQAGPRVCLGKDMAFSQMEYVVAGGGNSGMVGGTPTLNRDHGYPLRVIVPGVIGARSVKWLDSINIIAEECQGFFMQKDYKMFPPSVDWDNIDWSTRRPQMDFPVQCAICSLEDMSIIKPGKIKIKGYAVSGGGRGIERVDVSIDGGKSWVEALKYQRAGTHYISDADTSDKWAWVLFEVEAHIPQSTEIVAKAVDIAANVQPQNVEVIWNLRGILNTSWHRVQVRVGHSNL